MLVLYSILCYEDTSIRIMLNMAMLKAMQSHEKGFVEGTMHPFIVVKHNSNYLFYGYLTPFLFS